MKKEFTYEFQIRYVPIETPAERARYDRAMTLLAELFAEALNEIYEMDAAEKLKEIQEGDMPHANHPKNGNSPQEKKNNAIPGQTSR